MGFSKYKHRLELQSPAYVQDSETGELTAAWTEIGTVWAAIEPQIVRSREIELGNVIVGETYTKIRVRWSGLTAQLTTAHRGLHQGTVFNFANIVEIRMERREIEILATSGVNDG